MHRTRVPDAGLLVAIDREADDALQGPYPVVPPFNRVAERGNPPVCVRYECVVRVGFLRLRREWMIARQVERQPGRHGTRGTLREEDAARSLLERHEPKRPDHPLLAGVEATRRRPPLAQEHPRTQVEDAPVVGVALRQHHERRPVRPREERRGVAPLVEHAGRDDHRRSFAIVLEDAPDADLAVGQGRHALDRRGVGAGSREAVEDDRPLRVLVDAGYTAPVAAEATGGKQALQLVPRHDEGTVSSGRVDRVPAGTEHRDQSGPDAARTELAKRRGKATLDLAVGGEHIAGARIIHHVR